MTDGDSPRARRAALCLCTFAFIAIGFRSAAAQRSVPADTKPPTKELTRGETEVLLRERDREAMHPGQALVIVGREQDGNDLRSRTPALAQSDRAIATVSADELHRRTLAMYEDGGVFHEPLPSAPVSAEELEPQAVELPPPVEQVAIVPSSSHRRWTVGAAVGAAALVWALRRAGSLRTARDASVSAEEIAARR